MKENVFLGLLVILLVLVFFSCGNENNDPEIYTVTIGTLKNANGSTITASPSSGVEGTEITLTINEDNTYRLRSGTLKYGETAINETNLKFNLPAENVIITAEFKSFFIGSWICNDYDVDGETLSFYENGIFAVSNSNNKYYFRGTWVPNGNETINTTITHVNYNGWSNIDEFTQSDENNSMVGSIIEVKINTDITIKTGNYIYTLIQ